MTVYYHRIPNSVIRVMVTRYGAPVCEDIAFSGNKLDPEDIEDELLGKAAESYLAGIADRPGSNVSTTGPEHIEAQVLAARAAEMKAAAEEAHRKLVAAGEKP